VSIHYGTEPESRDPGRLRSEEDRPDDAVTCCDNCGAPLIHGAKSIAGVGVGCSSKCLNALCLKHEALMWYR
jgi:hypothetical protein